MSFIAPNLSQIVGSTVAAKLMGNCIHNVCVCVCVCVCVMGSFKGILFYNSRYCRWTNKFV